MLRLTLDTNCIVDIDENREPRAGCVRSLLAMHDAGKISLQLVATTASERQRTGPYLANFTQFQARLQRLGLGSLDLLKPIFVLDVSYFDWAILAGPDDITLLERIHSVLFPGHKYDLQDALATPEGQANPEKVEHNHRRRLLDVHAFWCHLHYGGDVFVTSDDDFLRPYGRGDLAQFGVSAVLSPCDAASL